jgi:hypothetical protein
VLLLPLGATLMLGPLLLLPVLLLLLLLSPPLEVAVVLKAAWLLLEDACAAACHKHRSTKACQDSAQEQALLPTLACTSWQPRADAGHTCHCHSHTCVVHPDPKR